MGNDPAVLFLLISMSINTKEHTDTKHLSCFPFKRTGGVIVEGTLHGRLRFSLTDPFSESQKVISI